MRGTFDAADKLCTQLSALVCRIFHIYALVIYMCPGCRRAWSASFRKAAAAAATFHGLHFSILCFCRRRSNDGLKLKHLFVHSTSHVSARPGGPGPFLSTHTAAAGPGSSLSGRARQFQAKPSLTKGCLATQRQYSGCLEDCSAGPCSAVAAGPIICKE